MFVLLFVEDRKPSVILLAYSLKFCWAATHILGEYCLDCFSPQCSLCCSTSCYFYFWVRTSYFSNLSKLFWDYLYVQYLSSNIVYFFWLQAFPVIKYIFIRYPCRNNKLFFSFKWVLSCYNLYLMKVLFQLDKYSYRVSQHICFLCLQSSYELGYCTRICQKLFVIVTCSRRYKFLLNSNFQLSSHFCREEWQVFWRVSNVLECVRIFLCAIFLVI